MTKRTMLLLALVALAAPQLIPQSAPQVTAPAAPQASVGVAPVGTIRGIVLREGTTDPIPDVQITVGGRGGTIAYGPGGESLEITPQMAEQVFAALARGATGIPPEILEAAEAARGAGAAARGATPPPAPLTATSDAEGRFTIKNVPAGNISLRAQLQGYFGPQVNGNYPTIVTTPVAVVADETTEARLVMLPGGTVSGRVYDPAGKPMSDAGVTVLRRGYENGVATLLPMNQKSTDDRGEYRLYRLPPGEYFLAATPRVNRGGAPATKEQPATTMYPNVLDSANATPIALRSGDDVSGMDIQVRTAPTSRISGKVISNLPAGVVVNARGVVRAATATVALAPRGKAGFWQELNSGPVTANAEEGTFEIANVPPGVYEIMARLPVAYGWGPQNPPERAGGAWAFGRATLVVQGDDLQGINIVVRPGADVKGRVIIDGKPAAANLRFTLQPDETLYAFPDGQAAGVLNQLSQYAPLIGEDGAFSIPVVPEGRYRPQVTLNAAPGLPQRGQANVPANTPVNVPPIAAARGVAGATAPATPAASLPPLPPNAYVADIRHGSDSIYDNGLEVGREAVDSIDVIVNTNGGSIAGTVMGVDQKPAANMMVVLVPPSNRRQNPALYKTVRSDAQGRFNMANLPPGAYKLFSWESILPGAYQSAEFIEGYEERGAAVTVTGGTRTSAEVEVIRAPK